MHLVPIPATYEALTKSFRHWEPFLDGIARRSKESVADLMAQIKRRDVQIALVWDGKQAHALVGMRIQRRGNDLIGEICWLTGRGMKQWRDLLPEIERYLKEHIGCVEIRPICRPGWSRFLKQHGYRITHYQMEKVL